MKKTTLNKIEKITGQSSRTEIFKLHEELTEAEDKAQSDYDAAMNEIHSARELLDNNSNDTGDA